jgi:hypothetical protein
MAFPYAELQQDAEALVADAGRDASLQKPGAKTGDAWDWTDGTPTATTVKVVVTSRVERNEPDTLVKRVDIKALISTSAGVVPERQDKLLLGSETVKIMDVQEIAPGDTTLLYKIEGEI